MGKLVVLADRPLLADEENVSIEYPNGVKVAVNPKEEESKVSVPKLLTGIVLTAGVVGGGMWAYGKYGDKIKKNTKKIRKKGS